jgi:hypothetical protein
MMTMKSTQHRRRQSYFLVLYTRSVKSQGISLSGKIVHLCVPCRLVDRTNFAVGLWKTVQSVLIDLDRHLSNISSQGSSKKATTKIKVQYITCTGLLILLP